MSSFTDHDAFSRVHGTRSLYQIDQPVIWDVGREGSSWHVFLKAGMTFDISVPRLLEWAQSPHDRRVLLAAAVHDELLNKGHDAAFASAEFRRAAIARGVPRWWAWVLFLATLIWTV